MNNHGVFFLSRYFLSLLLIVATSPVWATTVYTYTGNNFDTFGSLPGSPSHDESMRVSVTLEFTDPLEPDSPAGERMPISFSITTGVRTIDSANAWISNFSIGTDSNGLINSWDIALYTDQFSGPRWSIGTSDDGDFVYWCATPDRGGGIPCFEYDQASVDDRPGSWSVSERISECEVEVNQSSFVDGDTITADVFRIANLTKAPQALEWKVWLGRTGFSPISILNLGADGSMVLPAEFDENFGPLPLIAEVTPDLPRASYELGCRVLNPVTGEILAEGQTFINVQDSRTFVSGETGPAGGIVFRVTDGGLHGLEASPVDQVIPFAPGAEWGCAGTSIPGAEEVVIGAGAQNTAAILADCTEPGIAARIASDYSVNGFDDWYLPSFFELVNMLARSGDIGNLSSGNYWSSTEGGADSAFGESYIQNPIGPYPRGSRFGVRAIRSF